MLINRVKYAISDDSKIQHLANVQYIQYQKDIEL